MFLLHCIEKYYFIFFCCPGGNDVLVVSMRVSSTATVHESVDCSPLSSVTVSSKVSKLPFQLTAGAVNVVVAAIGFDSVTAIPPTCVHRYETIDPS